MLRLVVLVVASLAFITPVQTAEETKEAPAALERKMLGTWEGGPCIGELTFRADGTFAREHYSPGNNSVTGTWEVRWDALPPTLALTCKTSDAPDRIKVGETSEFQLVELNAEGLAYQTLDGKYRTGFERAPPGVLAENALQKELAALQGTWVPLQSEEGGIKSRGELNFKQIIQGDRVIFQVNGETKAEGKLVLEATQNPKRLDLQFTSGQTDLLIYVRAGDHVIYCGNRNGRTRPTAFASGTTEGGDYLQAWRIEK